MSEHRLELADVFRIHEDDFLAQSLRANMSETLLVA